MKTPQVITVKVELPTYTPLDLFHELMADAMQVTKEEAKQILHTTND